MIPISKIIDKRKNDYSCWKPSIFLMCRWFYFLWGNSILHFPALSISNKAWWKEGWWNFALLVVYRSYKSDWIKWDSELRTLSSITLPAPNYFNWFFFFLIQPLHVWDYLCRTPCQMGTCKFACLAAASEVERCKDTPVRYVW